MVGARAERNNLVLGQLQVCNKSNEITGAPELRGGIATLDAMGCHKRIAREIKDPDAAHVLGLKGNQERAAEAVRSFWDHAIAGAGSQAGSGRQAIQRAFDTLEVMETVEKDHGGSGMRRNYHSAELGWLADVDKWGGSRGC